MVQSCNFVHGARLRAGRDKARPAGTKASHTPQQRSVLPRIRISLLPLWIMNVSGVLFATSLACHYYYKIDVVSYLGLLLKRRIDSSLARKRSGMPRWHLRRYLIVFSLSA